MRSLILLAATALPALAEPPRISLTFGDDTLNAQADDIRSLRRIDEDGTGSALVIRLTPAFDQLMLALTSNHVGETGTLRICGETVVEPLLHAAIPEATFVISDTDIARIDRLQARLDGPTCDTVPES